MPVTDFLAEKLLLHSVGKQAYPLSAATYVGLYNTSPTDVGGGDLIEDAMFQQIRWTGTSYDSNNNVIIANTNVIIWSAASSEWGEVSHFGIFDGAAGSPHLLWYGEFDSPYEIVGIGDQFDIGAGEIILSLD